MKVMTVRMPRALLESVPLREGLIDLMDVMDTPEGIRAYVALRMVATRFSRAPETVSGFTFRLSEDAVESLIAETHLIPGFKALADGFNDALTEKREEDDARQHAEGRPKTRETTRTHRGYGFRR